MARCMERSLGKTSKLLIGSAVGAASRALRGTGTTTRTSLFISQLAQLDKEFLFADFALSQLLHLLD